MEDAYKCILLIGELRNIGFALSVLKDSSGESDSTYVKAIEYLYECIYKLEDFVTKGKINGNRLNSTDYREINKLLVKNKEQ